MNTQHAPRTAADCAFKRPFLLFLPNSHQLPLAFYPCISPYLLAFTPSLACEIVLLPIRVVIHDDSTRRVVLPCFAIQIFDQLPTVGCWSRLFVRPPCGLLASLRPFKFQKAKIPLARRSTIQFRLGEPESNLWGTWINTAAQS